MAYDAVDDVLLFGLNVWDKPYRASQFPVEFDIYIDSDMDNVWDIIVYNYDQSSGSDGRNVVKVFVPGVGTYLTYYVISNFDSNNWILPVPASLIGVDPAQPFGFQVFTADGYFTGEYWDASPADGVSFHKITLDTLRFELNDPADAYPVVLADSAYAIGYTQRTGADALASGSQTGFLFLYNEAPIGMESSAVKLAEAVTSASIILTPHRPLTL